MPWSIICQAEHNFSREHFFHFLILKKSNKHHLSSSEYAWPVQMMMCRLFLFPFFFFKEQATYAEFKWTRRVLRSLARAARASSVKISMYLSASAVLCMSPLKGSVWVHLCFCFNIHIKWIFTYRMQEMMQLEIKWLKRLPVKIHQLVTDELCVFRNGSPSLHVWK